MIKKTCHIIAKVEATNHKLIVIMVHNPYYTTDSITLFPLMITIINNKYIIFKICFACVSTDSKKTATNHESIRQSHYQQYVLRQR